ncbi:MAG: histidine kinase, partial [Gemmatimonadetes bacterium]|nr:histidine kinase [Gemmatimonadota bacterium]
MIQDANSRSFWTGFVGGWAAYCGLLLTFELGAQPGVLRPVLMAVVNTLPHATVAAIIALYRRRLLRPEWSTARTLGVHAVVGLAYAVTASALLIVVTEATGLRTGEMADLTPWMQFFMITLSGLVLYVIFIGFLMWSESVRRVQESYEAAAREAVLRAEAEARALRAQFNPHFVFNTLHSLMLLVRADPAAAERAIEDVATLIRFASIVQRRDLDTVPLAKELEVARRYVDLEQLRLEERLRVEWRIDLDPARFSIPAFSLQTLVENAIKHGIEPQVGGGSVVV